MPATARSIPRVAMSAVGLLATACAFAGCGEIANHVTPVASRAEPITLALDGPPDATDAGVFTAVANGDMRRAGLTVHTETPATSERALSLLQSGQVDLAVVPEPELMLARSQGSTVFGIGALVQRPISAVVTIRAKHERIASIAGLRGKRIGITGVRWQRDLLAAALAHAGVPATSVHEVNVGADPVGALLAHRVAAVYGGDAAPVEAALRARHKRVSALALSRAGVPNFDELVLVSRLVYFANHQGLLRRFVQALGRGYAAVRDDPSTGVQALQAADRSLDATTQTSALQAQLSAFFPSEGRPWGWQDQHEWNVFGRWMASQRLISGPRGWEKASVNGLLAGQGP